MSHTNSNKSREQYNSDINININDNKHNNKNNKVNLNNMNKNNNNMQYINYLTIKNGCKILQNPSKQLLSPYLNPQNILTQNMRQVWLSHSIPASCIIDVRNMKQKPLYINRVGFNCWHQYSSNPKLIQLQYTNDDDQQQLDQYNVDDHSDSNSRSLPQLRWTMLSKIRLQLRQGWQHFHLPLLLTANVKYLKLTIVENYSLSQVVNDDDDIHDDDTSVRVMEGNYDGGQIQYDGDDVDVDDDDDINKNYMLSRNIKSSNNDYHHHSQEKQQQRQIHKYMQQQSNTYLNQMSMGFVVEDKSDIIQSRVQKIVSSPSLLSNQINNNTTNNNYKQKNNKINPSNINNNNSNITNSNININNSRQRQKTFSQFRKTYHTTSTTNNNNTTSIPVQYQKQIRKLSQKIKQLSEQNQLIKHTVQKQNTLIMRLQNAVDLLVSTVCKMQNQLHKRQKVNINCNKQGQQSSNKKNITKKDKIKIYQQKLPKQSSQHKNRQVVNANIDQSQNSLSQYQGVMIPNNRNNNYINNNNNISNNKKDNHNNSNKRSSKQERNRHQQSVENSTNNNNNKNTNKNSTIRNSIQTPQTKQKTYIPMLQKLQELIMLRDQKKNRLQLTNNSKSSQNYNNKRSVYSNSNKSNKSNRNKRRYQQRDDKNDSNSDDNYSECQYDD